MYRYLGRLAEPPPNLAEFQNRWNTDSRDAVSHGVLVWRIPSVGSSSAGGEREQPSRPAATCLGPVLGRFIQSGYFHHTGGIDRTRLDISSYTVGQCQNGYCHQLVVAKVACTVFHLSEAHGSSIYTERLVAEFIWSGIHSRATKVMVYKVRLACLPRFPAHQHNRSFIP